MSEHLDAKAISKLRSTKTDVSETTIDNGATVTQMLFLAKVVAVTGDANFRKAFMQGLNYLLEAQYDNGGWPQFYPVRKGYYEHITFNDNAMTGILRLMREIVQMKSPYGFVDSTTRKRCQESLDKGIDIILKTQISVDGKLTGWCAQHDRNTLEPARARAYELPSVSGSESVGIVKFLMGIDKPSEQVKNAIESAVAWFDAVKIEGKKLVRKEDKSLPKGYDLVLVDDPQSGPLWARFYEIGTNRPIFVGRDGKIMYNLDEIEYERRVGYSYIGNYAETLLNKDYPGWKKKWGR